MTVQLAEDRPVEDVRLVLRRRIKLTGQVIGPDGQGLPGAAVYGLVEQEARDLTIADPYAVTDVGGVFVLGLPAATGGRPAPTAAAPAASSAPSGSWC